MRERARERERERERASGREKEREIERADPFRRRGARPPVLIQVLPRSNLLCRHLRHTVNFTRDHGINFGIILTRDRMINFRINFTRDHMNEHDPFIISQLAL